MRLCWFDTETTGLDYKNDKILEVACVITEGETFKIIDKYNKILFCEDFKLDLMDDWCLHTHKQNNLLNEVRISKNTTELIDKELSQFVKQYFNNEKAILAGNTIYFDKMFAKYHLPLFYDCLHFRVLDVSTFHIVFSKIYNIRPFSKKLAHRALDDILESIEELRHYTSFIETTSTLTSMDFY